MEELNLKKVIKRYNNLMDSMGYEHNTIGTILSENTENWNLRDMVSECAYVLETFYEEGHANNEGESPQYWQITPEDIMSPKKLKYIQKHNESEKEIRKYWLSCVRRLKNFISAYEPYIKDMKCTAGHASRYDN